MARGDGDPERREALVGIGQARLEPGLLLLLGNMQEELEDDSKDFLPAQSEVDVVALIEDEIILGLPSAPRHESCVLPASAQDNPEDSPFAVLKGLRSKAQ